MTRKRVSDLQNDAGRFHVEVNDDDDVIMYGKLPRIPDDKKVAFIAAAPVDRRTSFAGSGLPFASKEQAFDGSPNVGEATVEDDGSFAIAMKLPASYYVGLGTVLVPPTVFMAFNVNGKRTDTHVKIDHPVAFRLNTYPMQFTAARDSPNFYMLDPSPLPRTQEEILRASAYPGDNGMPSNFWGTKPPM